MQVDRTIDRFVLDLSIRNGLSCRGAYLDQEKDYLSGSTKATYQNKAYLSKNDPNLHNTPKDAIVFDAAVNAVVAPCFARGKYRQILNEAKYYQAIESIYDDFTAAVEAGYSLCSTDKTPGYYYAFRTSAGILFWLRYPTGRAQRWKLRRHLRAWRP